MTTIKPTRRDMNAAHDIVTTFDPTLTQVAQSYARHAAAERAIGYRMGIEAAAQEALDQAHAECDVAEQIERNIRALSDNAEAIARGE